jgi:hypothetical protein
MAYKKATTENGTLRKSLYESATFKRGVMILIMAMLDPARI